MEELRNMLAVMTYSCRYNELDEDGKDYIRSKADYLYHEFDGEISDLHHVILYSLFKGWL